ncbi:MAG: response regulator [Dehalococcoidia bacterium]
MQREPFLDARILIVDDQQVNVILLERILRRAGYTDITGVTDSREALARFAALPPDLLLLDLRMPHLDGYGVLEQLQTMLAADCYLPVLVLTAEIAKEARERALSSGARDFITKPFDQIEVLLRIDNLLQTRRLHLQIQGQNRLLEERVRERTRELDEARAEILSRLIVTAEFRDDETGQHVLRVGRTSGLLARALGASAGEAEMIEGAAPLHDLGKIAVADAILRKPARLDPDEFATMQQHTTIGACILAGSGVPMLQLAEQIALAHHERWDGSGYLHGLAGAAIPWPPASSPWPTCSTPSATPGRTSRPGRWSRRWPRSCAGAGQQFDPDVVAAFTREIVHHDLLAPLPPRVARAALAPAPRRPAFRRGRSGARARTCGRRAARAARPSPRARRRRATSRRRRGRAGRSPGRSPAPAPAPQASR